MDDVKWVETRPRSNTELDALNRIAFALESLIDMITEGEFYSSLDPVRPGSSARPDKRTRWYKRDR